MHPGRFVSLWFIYLGSLMLVSFLHQVAIGQHQLGLAIDTVSALLVAFATLSIGVFRILYPEAEAWPETYGLWAYVAGLLLVVMTVWVFLEIV